MLCICNMHLKHIDNHLFAFDTFNQQTDIKRQSKFVEIMTTFMIWLQYFT